LGFLDVPKHFEVGRLPCMHRTGPGVAVLFPVPLGGSFVGLGHCLTSLLWITPR
jgi:hypothetical protein